MEETRLAEAKVSPTMDTCRALLPTSVWLVDADGVDPHPKGRGLGALGDSWAMTARRFRASARFWVTCYLMPLSENGPGD